MAAAEPRGEWNYPSPFCGAQSQILAVVLALMEGMEGDNACSSSPGYSDVPEGEGCGVPCGSVPSLGGQGPIWFMVLSKAAGCCYFSAAGPLPYDMWGSGVMILRSVSRRDLGEAQRGSSCIAVLGYLHIAVILL